MNSLQLTLTQIVPILLSTESISSRSVSRARETFLTLLFLTVVAFVFTIRDFAEGGFHLSVDQLPWAKLVVCFIVLIATIIMFGRYKTIEKEYRESRPYTWMDEVTEGEPQTHFGQIR